MSHVKVYIASGGLHGRAVLATLRLVEERRDCISPSLCDVADALDEPLDRVAAMFPSNDALLVAAAEQSLVILMDACTKAVVRVDPNDPVAQFCALGEAYLDWAASHRVEFCMMSDPRLKHALDAPVLRRYADSLVDLVIRMLTRAKAEGYLHPHEDIGLLALSSRSLGYGLARMIVDERLADWAPGADPIKTAKSLLHDFIRRMARSSAPRQAVTD